MNVEIALQQLQFCRATVKANLGGITHEESLRQPTPAGNCANWILGHLVATRSNFLRVFGSEPVWSEAERARYDRHAPPITNGRDAKPIDEIWKAFEATQERLERAVSALTPERLRERSPFSPSNDPKETLGSMLATLGFHDAYHAGQTGVLRRLIGKPPADL
jgi:uncharacterized damage-inducible protein DinB